MKDSRCLNILFKHDCSDTFMLAKDASSLSKRVDMVDMGTCLLYQDLATGYSACADVNGLLSIAGNMPMTQETP